MPILHRRTPGLRIARQYRRLPGDRFDNAHRFASNGKLLGARVVFRTDRILRLSESEAGSARNQAD